jgi:hypothetical protein
VIGTFSSTLYLPDPLAVPIVLGAVAVNYRPGDPLWLMIVAPPGDGKTELLHSMLALPNTHLVSTLTEQALLSGTPRKDRAKGSKGGLLREVGDFGLLVMKDFGSILSMNRDSRGQVLAALREVYDGEWVRYVGAEGGLQLRWAGKVGLLAGATPAVDRHHAAIAALGERFLRMRFPDADADQMAEAARDGRESISGVRAELTDAVSGLFAGLDPTLSPLPLDARRGEQLISLAVLAARARSSVERDEYSRDVELVPPPETPTRIAAGLARLWDGMTMVGADADTAWRGVTRVAWDSIPEPRRGVLALMLDGAERTTREVGEAMDLPTSTARRTLEDLTAHRLVSRDRFGDSDNSAARWHVTTWTLEKHAAGFKSVPEMQGGPI